MDYIINDLNDLTLENYNTIIEKLGKINIGNITNELALLPPIYAYYFGLYSRARKEVAESQNELERYCAITRKETTEQRENLKFKTTEKLLDSIVMSLPDYKKLQDQIVFWTTKRDLLKGILTCLEQKKDALIQMSAQYRAETRLNG